MAAAAVSPFQTLVECPVCFDIYNKPQLLQCLHVLCKDCLDGIAADNQVVCPLCLNETMFRNIKVDFNMEALVESFHKAKEQPAGTVLPRQDVATNRYQRVRQMDIGVRPYRLHLYTNELWCNGEDNQLHVYDLECTHVRSVTLQGVSRVNTVIQDCHDHIIIACYGSTGLHELAADGRHVNRIQSGSYSDVTEHQSVMYAWEYEQKSVYTFTRGEKRMWFSWFSKVKTWMKHKSINCKVNTGDILDRLSVVRDNIYISSFSEHRVYRLDLSGRVLDSYSREAGQLYGSKLCRVDERGRMLVCDFFNDRLQLCDEAGEWSVINLTDTADFKWPQDAVLSRNNRCLWVCTSFADCHLFKFTALA